jgi:hypothetical protein
LVCLLDGARFHPKSIAFSSQLNGFEDDGFRKVLRRIAWQLLKGFDQLPNARPAYLAKLGVSAGTRNRNQ